MVATSGRSGRRPCEGWNVSTADRALRYEEPSRDVKLDSGTFQWVELRKFHIADPLADDAGLIESLLAHRAYRVTFWDGQQLGDEQIYRRSVHGPYPLSRIHPGLFEPVDAEGADAALFQWANDQDWNPPWAGQSAETMARLREEVCALFRRGKVYQLTQLTEDDYEEYTPIGWLGFVEFVVIDRDAGELHLVVAADD